MIIFILVALVMSLNLYSYSTSLPYSDYGIVSRGFPFPILKSGSSIYVGHNGRFAQAVGVKHILEATGKKGEFEFFLPGFVADLLFYGILGSIIIVLDTDKDSLIDKVKNTFINSGILTGGIKMLYLGLFGVIVLFIVFIFFTGLFSFLMDTLGIMW
jgi:hypothetical protein